MNSIATTQSRFWQRMHAALGRTETQTCRFHTLTFATLWMGALAFALCHHWGVHPAWNLNLYVIVQIIVGVLTIPIVGVAFGIACYVRRRRAEPFIKRRIAWLDFVKYMALFIPMAWIYTHIKAGVLLADTWDTNLHQWDLWLFAGHDPVLLTRSLIPEFCYPLFHRIYVALNPMMMGSILWLVLAGRRARARRLTAALYLGYFIGVLAYHALPAYGPAYAIAGNDSQQICVATHQLQQLLLERVQEVQAKPSSTVLWPWVYIAAFPSLHVSHVLIIAWYFRYSRIGLGITGAFAILSTISTVLFGWHYVVDWFGGIAVAGLAIWMASWPPARIRIPYWPKTVRV